MGSEKGLKVKILKGFKYNIVDMSYFSESNIKKWIELKWIEIVE